MKGEFPFQILNPQLVLRMLENSYTKKQFHQQVADAKQLQSDLVQPGKMLQKLDLVPT